MSLQASDRRKKECWQNLLMMRKRGFTLLTRCTNFYWRALAAVKRSWIR